MVRFKNRYLLCEVIFESDIDLENDVSSLLQPVAIRNVKIQYVLTIIQLQQIQVFIFDLIKQQFINQAIADAIQINYGDFGSAQTSLNLQVKYVNSMTRLFIIRTARDHIDILWNSINFFKILGEQKVKIRVLHSSGTIKKQEIVAKRYLSRWMHKMLKRVDSNDSIKNNLLQKYEIAKEELEALDQ